MSFRLTALSALLAGVAAPALAAPDTPPGAADETPDRQSSDILVTGRRPVSDAASGTKSTTPLVETPQSIAVISREQLDLRGVQSLNQALELTAGVTPNLRGANAEIYDQFKLRGFDAPRYVDGLKIFTSPTGYADTQIDISRVDRIEVIKGPASVLYGQSSPGGLVAFSSKLPLGADPYGSVAATYGTYNLYRVDGDVGGKLNDSGSLLYRVAGSVNGADTQQTFGKRRRYTINPAVTIGAGGATTLTLLANYSHDPDLGNYGAVPLLGSLDPNPNGRISTHRADGEPSINFRRNQAAGSYFLTHDFGGDWVFRANGRYTDIKSRLRGVYTTGLPTDATLTTFGRGAYATRERLKNWTLDNQLAGTVETGPIRHSLLVGLDQQFAKANEAAGFGAAPSLNFFDPVYGTFSPNPDPLSYGGGTIYNVNQRQTGLYAQDQMALGGFRLTLSGRHDWARGRSITTFAGNAPARDVKKDTKFTYRIGALYLTDAGFAPYASYSTSFEPQTQRVIRPDGSTGIADPSEGKQWEAGVKYQPPGTPILVTAAYFDITQSNVVVSNPLAGSPATQNGKVRSNGVEVEANVPLFKGFELTGAYSRQKVRTTRDDNPLNLGRPLIQTGRGGFSLLGNYTVQDGSLAGLGLGATVRRVSRGYGGYITDATGANVTRDVYIPAYTAVDAVASYDLGKVATRMAGVKLSINAANLFDNKYVSSCYASGIAWCWYGARRTVQATIGYRW